MLAFPKQCSRGCLAIKDPQLFDCKNGCEPANFYQLLGFAQIITFPVKALLAFLQDPGEFTSIHIIPIKRCQELLQEHIRAHDFFDFNQKPAPYLHADGKTFQH
jgi:hypothetical protein